MNICQSLAQVTIILHSLRRGAGHYCTKSVLYHKQERGFGAEQVLPELSVTVRLPQTLSPPSDSSKSEGGLIQAWVRSSEWSSYSGQRLLLLLCIFEVDNFHRRACDYFNFFILNSVQFIQLMDIYLPCSAFSPRASRHLNLDGKPECFWTYY